MPKAPPPSPLETLLRDYWQIFHMNGDVDSRWRYLISVSGFPMRTRDARKHLQAEIDATLSEPIDVDRLIHYQRLSASNNAHMIAPRKRFIALLRHLHGLCDLPLVEDWPEK